nr:MAG TPA: intron associated endonuclease [Caudoviricetes sp.]
MLTNHNARTSPSGVYLLWCNANNMFYVGQSVDMQRRCSEHFSRLRSGVHKNPRLQAAYDEYGEAAFEVRYVISCAIADLMHYEQVCFNIFSKRYESFNTGEDMARPALGRKRGDRDKCVATLDKYRAAGQAAYRKRIQDDPEFAAQVSANCRRAYMKMRSNPQNELKRKKAAAAALQTPEFREGARQRLLARYAAGTAPQVHKHYSVRIKCTTTGIVYDSYQEAAGALGKSPATIHRWVNGRKSGGRITDKKDDWIIYED